MVNRVESEVSEPIQADGRTSAPPRSLDTNAPRYRDLREVALTLFVERGYRGTTMRDIAQAVGIRAPSLYNHLNSKQGMLREIMFDTMDRAFAVHRAAIEGVDDVTEQLHRAAEAHALLTIDYRREVLITHHEIPGLDEPDQTAIRDKQREYVRKFCDIIDYGSSLGRFEVESPRVASFALLEMLNGLEKWYRETGQHSKDDVVRQYGDFALRIVGYES
jgi:AcrR family transcriptional regulator